MSLNAPYTPNTVIQSTQVSNDLVGLSNGSNDTATNSMSTYRSESNFDYVTSGCVWSGDSYGSTRAGSQTSGVVYITGVRLPVAAVSAHVFTASKDTYIDINGSGVQVYTEATNNAASPALTAGSIRIGIIITGATNIAAATSVNQGQETILLPIASSTPYAVTDSLGNLICCRDVNRKMLGYRQITAATTLTTPTAATLLTGLTCPVIIPTNRKIRGIVDFGLNISGTSGVFSGGICTGSASDVNRLKQGNYTAAVAYPSVLEYVASNLTGSQTYVVFGRAGAGNVTVNADPISPSFIRIELE